MESLSVLLREISCWYDDYAHSFYSDDDEIQRMIVLKEEHTAKVRQICRELALNFGLSERDIQLAEILGILHDVGRFSQFLKYHTFVDYLSEDHALLGIKIISEQSFIEKFLPEDRYLIFYAIQYHNKKAIAFSPDKRASFFAKLLRDADKMDIYRVLEPLLCQPDDNGISPVFLQNFLAGVQCNYSDCRTEDDKKIIRLMWAYDINSSWALEQIVQKGYFDKIYQNLPHTPEIVQGMNKLCDYVRKKCAVKDSVNFSDINQEAGKYVVKDE